MAMLLVPEDVPLAPEIVATRTSLDGNCPFNAVLLALVADKTQMSLLRLLVTVELLLYCEFYVHGKLAIKVWKCLFISVC